MSEAKNFSKNKDGIEYLTEPLTIEQMKERLEEENYITGVVQISFSDVISSNLDGLLDLMVEKLTGRIMVQDINYNVVGVLEDGDTLLVKVSGDISDILDEYDRENE